MKGTTMKSSKETRKRPNRRGSFLHACKKQMMASSKEIAITAGGILERQGGDEEYWQIKQKLRHGF